MNKIYWKKTLLENVNAFKKKLFMAVYVPVLVHFGLVQVETRKRVTHHWEISSVLVISALNHNLNSNFCQG